MDGCAVLYLEASVADARDDTLVLGRLGVPERRADRPPDGAVLHLELVAAALGEPELLAVEPRVAGLGDDRGVAGQHALDVLEEDVDPKRLVGLAVGRLAVGDEDAAVVVVRRGVAPEALGERAEELGHEDAAERRAVADHHAVGLHDDGLLPLEQEGVADGAVVVEDGPGEEVGVGGLHDLGAEGGADGAPVGADEARVVLRHQALGGRHDGERVPAGVRDGGERLPGLGHPDLGPAHHHRLHRLVEEVGRRLHGVLQVGLVAQPRRDEHGHRIPAEGRVGEAGQVAADADVHGLALPQRRRDGRVDLLMRVVQVVDDGLPRVERRYSDAEQLAEERR
jgi:hypothetical protein